MKLSDAIYNRVQYYMKINNIKTLWDLYKITGVPKATINSLFSTRKSSIPKLTTLIQICNGLNTDLQDFLMILFLKILMMICRKYLFFMQIIIFFI